MALGPSEELEVEVQGLGRGIDNILPAGGTVVTATGRAVASAELAAAAGRLGPAATKPGCNRFVSAKKQTE